MLTTPRAPWFVVLAFLVAAIATWENVRLSKAQREAEAKAADAPKPLPPPAPALELVGPPKGSTFTPGQGIEHAWTLLPGATEYLLDFAVPQPDGGCAFDAPRKLTETHAVVSHDDLRACMVWRVRAADQRVGSTYTIGAPPGCTMPPSMMVLCIEQ
jgi:hypothetical protein